MAAADRNARGTAIGIDVGGTKIAAGVVDTSTGAVLDRRRIPTLPQRGGAAVLADCAALAAELGGARLPVGIALCELVDLEGRPVSGDTVDWRGLDVAAEVGAPVVVESDVRAAALAEARFGAGVGVSPFLYVVVGTGASACLVIEGRPYSGARGEALVLGGGLGAAPAFGERVERALHDRLAYPRVPPLPVAGSSLGADGGVVGAALLAAGARR